MLSGKIHHKQSTKVINFKQNKNVLSIALIDGMMLQTNKQTNKRSLSLFSKTSTNVRKENYRGLFHK